MWAARPSLAPWHLFVLLCTWISVPKTKVMSAVPTELVAFTCNGNRVEKVSSCKIFGPFHQSGAISCDRANYGKGRRLLGDCSVESWLIAVWQGHQPTSACVTFCFGTRHAVYNHMHMVVRFVACTVLVLPLQKNWSFHNHLLAH